MNTVFGIYLAIFHIWELIHILEWMVGPKLTCFPSLTIYEFHDIFNFTWSIWKLRSQRWHLRQYVIKLCFFTKNQILVSDIGHLGSLKTDYAKEKDKDKIFLSPACPSITVMSVRFLMKKHVSERRHCYNYYAWAVWPKISFRF